MTNRIWGRAERSGGWACDYSRNGLWVERRHRGDRFHIKQSPIHPRNLGHILTTLPLITAAYRPTKALCAIVHRHRPHPLSDVKSKRQARIKDDTFGRVSSLKASSVGFSSGMGRGRRGRRAVVVVVVVVVEMRAVEVHQAVSLIIPTHVSNFLTHTRCHGVECFKCGQEGHWASACPNEDSSGQNRRGSGGRRGGTGSDSKRGGARGGRGGTGGRRAKGR